MAKRDAAEDVSRLLGQLPGVDVPALVEKLKAFTSTEEGKKLISHLLTSSGQEKNNGQP